MPNPNEKPDHPSDSVTRFEQFEQSFQDDFLALDRKKQELDIKQKEIKDSATQLRQSVVTLFEESNGNFSQFRVAELLKKADEHDHRRMKRSNSERLKISIGSHTHACMRRGLTEAEARVYVMEKAKLRASELGLPRLPQDSVGYVHESVTRTYSPRRAWTADSRA